MGLLVCASQKALAAIRHKVANPYSSANLCCVQAGLQEHSEGRAGCSNPGGEVLSVTTYVISPIMAAHQFYGRKKKGKEK